MADAGPLDLCEAEQSELARRYVLTSELYVEEPWSHAGPRSVSPFAPCAASRLPHVFDAARLTGDSVLWVCLVTQEGIEAGNGFRCRSFDNAVNNANARGSMLG